MSRATTRTNYISLEEILYLHKRLLERFGGSGGVRDLGLIESALWRPRSGYYTTRAEQAAALLQSLARNHAFVDGNKRVAFAAMDIFIRMNGQRLTVSADEAETFLLESVIQRQADVAEIAKWVESKLQSTR